MTGFVLALLKLASHHPRCLITALGAEVAELEPTTFVAVTVARMVRPASAVTSVYLLALAPGTSTHAPPEASQRPEHAQDHLLGVGVEPAQLPFDVLIVLPTMVGPVMAGALVLRGGAR